MLASATLDSGDFLWPSASERSWRELARRNCSALGVVSGGQEAGRYRQGGKGSRPLGIGVDSAMGFRAEMRSSLRGGWDQERGGVCIELCVLCFVVIHSSFLCSSVPSLLRFFSYPPAPGLCRMQTEGASGVEVLLAFGTPLGLPLRSFWSIIGSARLSQPFRVLAMSFGRLDLHQSFALVLRSASTNWRLGHFNTLMTVSARSNSRLSCSIFSRYTFGWFQIDLLVVFYEQRSLMYFPQFVI